MPSDDLPVAARLDALELLVREMLGFRPPIERMNIVTGAGAAMAKIEAEAALSRDQVRLLRAAEGRAALQRMVE